MILTAFMLLTAAVALLTGIIHVTEASNVKAFCWLLLACVSLFGATR